MCKRSKWENSESQVVSCALKLVSKGKDDNIVTLLTDIYIGIFCAYIFPSTPY